MLACPRVNEWSRRTARKFEICGLYTARRCVDTSTITATRRTINTPHCSCTSALIPKNFTAGAIVADFLPFTGALSLIMKRPVVLERLLGRCSPASRRVERPSSIYNSYRLTSIATANLPGSWSTRRASASVPLRPPTLVNWRYTRSCAT